jgi:hypothetical protein
MTTPEPNSHKQPLSRSEVSRDPEREATQSKDVAQATTNSEDTSNSGSDDASSVRASAKGVVSKGPRRATFRHALLERFPALLTVVAYLAIVIRSAKNLGFSRDESFYFDASAHYALWFRDILDKKPGVWTRAAIDGPWGQNHEHPSLVKSAFGLSWLFLHDRWKLVREPSLCFRLPGMLFAALGVYLIMRLTKQVLLANGGKRQHEVAWYTYQAPSVAAGVLFGMMPRMFYHAHLACFDVPATTMWIASITMLERAHRVLAEANSPAAPQSRGRRLLSSLGALLGCGLTYGLLLETKHNAWLMPAVVLPHLVATVLLSRSAKAALVRLLPALSMGLLGPIVFVGLWPWLWHDTVARVREYVAFHTHHDYYNIEFLGRNYYEPPFPWTYAPVSTVLTVPTTTLVLFLIGAVIGLWAIGVTIRASLARSHAAEPKASLGLENLPNHVRQAGELSALLWLGFAVPIAVFFLPSTPIFGGTKHWFPAYPSLAIFAGVGMQAVCTWLPKLWRAQTQGQSSARSGGRTVQHTPIMQHVLVALAVLLPVVATSIQAVHAHPFALGSYVALAGGTRGGADLGMCRQFWGFTTQSLDPYFRKRSKPGETVFIHDTTYSAWLNLTQEGRIPKHLRQSIWTIQDTDTAIVHHEKHMIEAEANIWTVYGTTAPDYILTHDGVPIILVYRRPSR